jgi:hypothetical protein
MTPHPEKSLNPTKSDSDDKLCVGCYESILSSASICPHCGSRQNVSRWLNLDRIFKYIGAVTALASMLFGSYQLYTLVRQSQQKSVMAAHLVRGAKLQLEIDDHEVGQQLLRQALEIAPGSQEAMDLLVDMGMEILQGLYPLDSHVCISVNHDEKGVEFYDFHTYCQKSFPLLEDIQLESMLSRAILKSKGKRRAKLLAHMAWLKLALGSKASEGGVNRLFKEAIKADPNNLHANTMLAAWLLSGQYRGELEEKETERRSMAFKHFDIALRQTAINQKQPEDKYFPRAWIRSIQLCNLRYVDELAVVDQMIQNGEPVGLTLGVTRGNFIALSGGTSGSSNVNPSKIAELEKALTIRFDTDRLLELAYWLAEKTYGCIPGGACPQDAGREACQMLYAIGRIHELGGDSKNAHKLYLQAQVQHQRSGRGWWSDFIDSGLQRTRPGE